ncbi:CPXCG motif-containing cysteine-rich protein [Algibacillus agarilyticus]|uniref:CPXCG motif-containing cysteine-rich protein n=1 Tax=Algibacillus agarilyticus TaxID=2234133 RepID=UPI000DCFAD80|nr:CPXCG motif-containing cysteine-rich protein [Algibacillus agarilyticus]
MGIADRPITCPHCGNHIHVLLDASNGDQDYYEDCPACCNAIHINFHLDEVNEKLDLDINDE